MQVFDWNKTTAIGMYDGKAEYNYGELQCVAHKHGARILDWNQASAAFGKLGFGRRDPAFLGNATAVGIYADYMANYVSTAGIDGIICRPLLICILNPEQEFTACVFGIEPIK